MSTNRFKLAVVQIRTELIISETVEKAGKMIAEAAANGAQVVALPEMWSCPYSREYFRKYTSLGHEELTAAMSSWARENGIVLVGGSVPEKDGDKTYNTCFVFDKEGKQIAKHRKVHLFDINTPTMRFRESGTFTPGNEITVFDTEYGRMGAAICYDVRFAELFRAMAMRGAEIVFLPAQYNVSAGPRAWELALRSRSADNEFFFVGASCARYVGFPYECWGHSAVADPGGNIIASCDEKEQILYCDIDLAKVDEVRGRLHTLDRLRRDVYTVAE